MGGGLAMDTVAKTLVVWNGTKESSVNSSGDVIDILDGFQSLSPAMQQLGWWTTIHCTGTVQEISGFLSNHPGTQVRTHQIALDQVTSPATFTEVYLASKLTHFPEDFPVFGNPSNELG